MQERCVGDVVICKALWRFLQPDGYSQQAIELEHRVATICDEITTTGVPFDIVAAERLREQWTTRRSILETQLTQQFPGVKLSSRPQIGALLEARGWVPERRTEKTQQPKIDDELLETIPALYPEFAGLGEHFTLGRRLAQLAHGNKAWCKAVAADGRIHGGILHIGTPHSRAKHLEPNLAQVPNPKKGTPFGAECRGLFQARDDWVFVTADQAGLQDRGFAHYLSGFDAGAYAKTFVNGTGSDTHWQSSTALDLVPADTARNKDSKVHTAIREGAKRFRYAFLFGAGGARAGHIICDIARAVHQIDVNNDLQQRFFGGLAHPNEAALKRVGKQALNKFEAATPGLRRLRERLQVHARKHGWLPGLDGRRVPVRALHSALNFIVTSSEAIICKRWLVRVHEELCTKFRYGWDGDVTIVLWVHDEIACCCRPEIAAQVGEIMVRHAKEPAEFYNFKVPLDADYKIGRSWAGEPADTPRTITAADIDEINKGLKREGIKPIPSIDYDDDADLTRHSPTDHSEITHPESSYAVEFEVPATRDKELPPPPPQVDDPPARSNGHAGNGFDNYAAGEEKPRGNIKAHFVYCTADGQPYLRVTKTTTKKFWQSHWEEGCWKDGAPKGPKILYRLPDFIAAPAAEPVWICEGEKDTDSVAALGLIATTNPGGAGKWRPELTQHFQGKERVYIAEDNDDPGRAHTRKIVAALQGVVPNITVISFLELPVGGDVSDWLENHSKEELIARAQATPPYKPPRLSGARASSYEMEALDWLWPDRFALGKVGLIVGLPDEGKGQLLCYMMAKITRAAAWPCEEGWAPQGNVILLTAEDDIKDTVVPRLVAAGADLDRVEIIGMVRDGTKDRMFDIASDLELLREKIVEVGDVRLVEIDPITAYLGVGKIDSFRNTDVRAVLAPLVELAAELNVAVIAVMHFNKKTDVTNVLLRISDSLAFAAVARHVYGVIDDPENERKLLVRAKNNVAAKGKNQTLTFRFDAREVGTDRKTGKAIVAPFIVFEDDYVDVTAMEAMAAAVNNGVPAARDTAKKFLFDLLVNGPMLKTEIVDVAEANGIKERTLWRVKKELGVVAERQDPHDPKSKWTWRLPDNFSIQGASS